MSCQQCLKCAQPGPQYTQFCCRCPYRWPLLGPGRCRYIKPRYHGMQAGALTLSVMGPVPLCSCRVSRLPACSSTCRHVSWWLQLPVGHCKRVAASGPCQATRTCSAWWRCSSSLGKVPSKESKTLQLLRCQIQQAFPLQKHCDAAYPALLQAAQPNISSNIWHYRGTAKPLAHLQLLGCHTLPAAL